MSNTLNDLRLLFDGSLYFFFFCRVSNYGKQGQIESSKPALSAPSNSASGSRSLSDVVAARRGHTGIIASDVKSVSSSVSSTSPFATEFTFETVRAFDELERKLTFSMSEKTTLEEELSR